MGGGLEVGRSCFLRGCRDPSGARVRKAGREATRGRNGSDYPVLGSWPW